MLVKAISGGNCLLRRKDGTIEPLTNSISIASAIQTGDPFEDLGITIVREAALQTFEKTGAAFSETVLLCEEKFREGMEKAMQGSDPLELKKGLDVEMERLLIEVDQTAETRKIEQPDTLVLESGYVSPYFVTNAEKMSVELNDPHIYITQQKLKAIYDVAPLLEKTTNLLIIAEDIDGEALATLVINCIKGGLKIAALKTTKLAEIARQTGAELFSANKGAFGRAKKVILTKDATFITTYPRASADGPFSPHFGLPASAAKELIATAYTTASLLLTSSAMVAKKRPPNLGSPF